MITIEFVVKECRKTRLDPGVIYYKRWIFPSSTFEGLGFIGSVKLERQFAYMGHI